MLADPSNDLYHCLSLCIGSCKYVSYATQGSLQGQCFGGPNCNNGGDNEYAWVSYVKGKLKILSTTPLNVIDYDTHFIY